jgi:hypothetical protein
MDVLTRNQLINFYCMTIDARRRGSPPAAWFPPHEFYDDDNGRLTHAWRDDGARWCQQ